MRRISRGRLTAGVIGAGKVTVITADRMLDPERVDYLAPATVMVVDDTIVDVAGRIEVPDSATRVDLGAVTLLPGFIDAHTHIMLDGAVDFGAELDRNSRPFRAIRAAVLAGRALEFGFTTLRDVGNQGTMFSDADVKKAIETGLIPGPRLWIATRSISTPGRYLPQDWSWELDLPQGAQMVAGVDECRRAVREHLAGGADLIKVFADWDVACNNDGGLSGCPNFTDGELMAIVDEARRAGVYVAAHAMSEEGIAAAIDAGVRSIEHGNGFTEALLLRAKERGVYWCPTLLACDHALEGIPEENPGRTFFHQVITVGHEALRRGRELGVKIAVGSDAGSFPWRLNPAREFALLADYGGFSPLEAIRAGTTVAADLLGVGDRLGRVAPGYVADLVAVNGNPLQDLAVLQEVVFVMKDGVVIRDR